MDDKLHNDLKNRIKEVFDNFDDPSADEGWLQLRKKFPEERSNRRALAWIWWGAAAAVLLLFLGIGIWTFNNNYKQTKRFTADQRKLHEKNTPATDGNNIAAGKKRNIGNEKNISAPDKPGKDTNTSFAETEQANKSSIAGSSAKKMNSLKGVLANNTSTRSGRLTPPSSAQFSEKNLNQSKTIVSDNIAKSEYAVTRKPASNEPALRGNSAAGKIVDSNRVAVEKTPDQQSIITIKPNANPLSPGVDTVNHHKKIKSITDMFAADKNMQKTEKAERDSKKVRFDVYEATYFNYAKGSSNQINEGGGFTADIAITKNLKLVTGVSVGQNSLNYAGTSSIAALNATMLTALTPATSAAATYYGTSPSSFAAIKNYDASLVSLDIPLNLKYEFNPQKGNIYVVAGFSSGTFINESYTYQYNYPTYFPKTLQQTQDETNNKSFDSFYFAKTLNVAFGVGYPFGRNHLVIEPFLKYPLEGLGAQQIRFGAGGINLKFNFATKK